MPASTTENPKKTPTKEYVTEKGKTKVGGKFADTTDETALETKDMNNVELFEAGLQTDSAGNEIDWTVPMLEEIAANYNATNPVEKNIAPAVLGHPEEGTYPSDDAPAYGWLHNVRVVGTKLVGDFRKCASKFVDWVKNEAYPNRSISITDTMNIAHVGFLGAVAPAVKTLEPVKFKVNKQVKTYTFAVTDTPATTTDTPVETTSTGRAARSTQYGISAVADQGYDEKPAHLSDLTDDQFADPVNYRLPLTEEFIDTSVKTWGKEYVQEQYNEADRQKIAARLILGMVKYGFEIPSYWCYKETAKGHTFKFGKNFVNVSAELLPKKLLVDIVNGTVPGNQQPTNQQSTSDNLSLTKKEFADMPTIEQLQAIMQKLLEAANAGLPTDAATMYAPWHQTAVDEIAALFAPAAADGTPPANNAAPVTPVIAPAFSESAEFKAMQKQLDELKTDKRIGEHTKFAQDAVSKGNILPSQVKNVIELREALSTDTPKVFEFSQNTGKVKVDQTKAFDMLIGYLNQFDYSQQATGERASVVTASTSQYANTDEESAIRANEIKNFMAKEKKENNVTYTFEQAAKIAPKGAR